LGSPIEWCRIGSAGGDGIIFSWPDDGAADGIPTGTIRNGTSCAWIGCDSFYARTGTSFTGIMLAARQSARLTRPSRDHASIEEVEAIEAWGIGPLRFLGRPADARAFCPDALPESHIEHGRNLCHQR
jgi:hypothetical protein